MLKEAAYELYVSFPEVLPTLCALSRNIHTPKPTLCSMRLRYFHDDVLIVCTLTPLVPLAHDPGDNKHFSSVHRLPKFTSSSCSPLGHFLCIRGIGTHLHQEGLLVYYTSRYTASQCSSMDQENEAGTVRAHAHSQLCPKPLHGRIFLFT